MGAYGPLRHRKPLPVGARLRTSTSSDAEEMPITCSPSASASWIAYPPTAPAAPVTINICPGDNPIRSSAACGQSIHWLCCSLFQAHAIWHADDRVGRHDWVFGLRASASDHWQRSTQYALANVPAAAGVKGIDGAGKFHAGDVRRSKFLQLGCSRARPHPDVRRIHSCGCHPHAHFTWIRLRYRQIGQFEDLRSSKPGECNCFHLAILRKPHLNSRPTLVRIDELPRRRCRVEALSWRVHYPGNRCRASRYASRSSIRQPEAVAARWHSLGNAD